MIQKNSKKLIAVVGPTAIGKTSLAVFLAKKLDGEIVSADSRQVYKGLDIGTGKEGQPAQDAGISKSKFLISNKISKSKNENCKLKIENLKRCQRFIDNIPQWLIDITEPETIFTMFDWLDNARIIIEDIFSRGKLPIIVGGTGLYVQALIEGFTLEKSEIRNPKSETNSKSQISKYQREELNKMPLAELQKLVKSLPKKLIPNSYNLDLNNPRRLIRLIERAQSGEQMTKKKPDFEVLQIGIDLSREELYQKIDKRVDDRFKQGMLEEVAGLLDRGVDPDWLIKLGLEYRIITEFLTQTSNLKTQTYNSKTKKLLVRHCEESSTKQSISGRLPRLRLGEWLAMTEKECFKAMKQNLKFKIHGYARRQLTWFRRFPQIKWVKNKKEALEMAKEFVV